MVRARKSKGDLLLTMLESTPFPPGAHPPSSNVECSAASGSTGVVVKSEPVEKMDLFASEWPPLSTPEEANLLIGDQGAASGSAASPPVTIKREPAEQTAVTKRVRFAPVALLDEGDVEYVCGIHGCPLR